MQRQPIPFTLGPEAMTYVMATQKPFDGIFRVVLKTEGEIKRIGFVHEDGTGLGFEDPTPAEMDELRSSMRTNGHHPAVAVPAPDPTATWEGTGYGWGI